MATYEDYTEKTELTFDGTYQLIGNDPSDATERGYWYISADDFQSYLQTEFNIKDMDLTAQPTYEALLYFVGSNGTINKKMTLPKLIEVLTETTNGLNLDTMFDSAGNNILSTRKGAIVSFTDSTGGTGSDTLAGYTITALTDSSTGTPTTTLNNVTATFSQTILNDNFATIATALNALATALNGDNDVSSISDKIEELLLRLRPTSGHGLIS